MLNNGQFAPLSIRPSPGRHASQRSYLTSVLSSYSPLHGPVSGITLLSTRRKRARDKVPGLVLYSNKPFGRDPDPILAAQYFFMVQTTRPTSAENLGRILRVPSEDRTRQICSGESRKIGHSTRTSVRSCRGSGMGSRIPNPPVRKRQQRRPPSRLGRLSIWSDQPRDGRNTGKHFL